MIKVDKKVTQDFLSREWCKRLLDAGVDMSDAKWFIGTIHNEEYLAYKEMDDYLRLFNPIPTYTVSELLYKLHEWIYPVIDGDEYTGPLAFFKDAPFYCFYYKLTHCEEEHVHTKTTFISAQYEHPIESLASVLLQCHQKDIGCRMPDTGNIADKE